MELPRVVLLVLVLLVLVLVLPEAEHLAPKLCTLQLQPVVLLAHVLHQLLHHARDQGALSGGGVITSISSTSLGALPKTTM